MYCENSYKNTDFQLSQIIPTAVDRFQTQTKNILTVQKNTYNNITLNQTHCNKHRGEEIQQHRDMENRSINTIENQFLEFCQKQQNKLIRIKNPHISRNSNTNLQNWSRNNPLIVGNSILSGSEERRISKRDRKVKVEYFPGATINMYNIKPLLKNHLY